MNFKEWLLLSESNFFQITDEQKQAVLNIAKRFKELKDSDKEKILYDEMINQEFAVIPFIDKQGNNRPIKIFINFDIDGLAAYHPRQHIITFTWDYIRKNSELQIYQTLTHELGHAIDPKLYPNSKHKTSDKYYDYVKHLKSAPNKKSSRMHFIEPIEVDAEGLSMSNHVIEYFKALKSIEEKQNFISELETWFKNHFNKKDNYSPPNVLSSYYRSFAYARSKPTLFRQYQKRFYKLIQILKANITMTGSDYNNISDDDYGHPKNYQRLIYPPDNSNVEEV